MTTLRQNLSLAWITTLLPVVAAGCTPTPKPDQKSVQEQSVDKHATAVHAISLEMANRFHLAALSRMIFKVPAELGLQLHYAGILATDLGIPGGQRVHGGIGAPYEWEVTTSDGSSIFTISVSTVRSTDNDIECRVKDEKLFITIVAIQGATTLTADEIGRERASIGGRSIGDLLLLLQESEEDIEKE